MCWEYKCISFRIPVKRFHSKKYSALFFLINEIPQNQMHQLISVKHAKSDPGETPHVKQIGTGFPSERPDSPEAELIFSSECMKLGE